MAEVLISSIAIGIKAKCFKGLDLSLNTKKYMVTSVNFVSQSFKCQYIIAEYNLFRRNKCYI
jgi:hypothetical protein